MDLIAFEHARQEELHVGAFWDPQHLMTLVYEIQRRAWSAHSVCGIVCGIAQRLVFSLEIRSQF